jgi:hypothetical protein
MKKSVLFFVTFICFGLIIQAQTPKIDGIWESTSGNQFQVERNSSGFRYKNLANNNIIQAFYVGDNYGIPSYRADFTDGSFQLYMVVSSNEITTSNSYDPMNMHTWTKIKGSTNNQNQNAGNQYNGNFNNTQRSEKKCDVCDGTGYSKSVVWAPNYTGEKVDDEWCETCKAYRKPHTHNPCGSCGGRGVK